MTRPDLAGLVGARICHDLISPIGAIGNGVELLGLSGEPPSPELKLIAESVAGASAKVRFLRVAFGRADTGQSLPADEIRSILRDIAAGTKLAYDWQVTEPVSRAEVRCAFLALLCLQSALPLGGSITVSASSGVWHIFAQGRTIKLDRELWDQLTGPSAEADATTPSDVHFALLPEAAAKIGKQPRWAEQHGGLSVTF